jgi:hypothetical protein
VDSQRGQATIEWTGVVLLVALTFGAAIALVPIVDGRSFGSWLAHSVLCAVRSGCVTSADALQAAYGERDAALVRRHAPGIVYEPGERSLPVDFRRCRSRSCADAADDPALDATRSDAGTPAAVFTHVARRGGETFLQYWLYYPDSDTRFPGSHAIWAATVGRTGRGYPGYHRDDWESYSVRLGADGSTRVRASSHHWYQGCKERQCRNRWMDGTGWTRVSAGSHAGHIPFETQWDVAPARRRGPAQRRVTGYRPLLPGRDLRERTTSAAALELIPIETLDGEALATDFGEVVPPWRKRAYGDPLSDSTG